MNYKQSPRMARDAFAIGENDLHVAIFKYPRGE